MCKFKQSIFYKKGFQSGYNAENSRLHQEKGKWAMGYIPLKMMNSYLIWIPDWKDRYTYKD